FRMSEAEATAALKARVRQLEEEMKGVKAENSLLKMRVQSDLPLCQTSPLATHEFRVEIKTDAKEISSDTYSVDGIDLHVKIEILSKINGPYQRETKFAATLHAKNVDASKRKFVMTTIEVREKERYSSVTPRYNTILHPHAQRFVLCSSEEESGSRKSFQSSNESAFTLFIRLTVVVQAVSSLDLDDGSATVVVVKNKEFAVSSQYLSLWSGFFRAYFAADMKEKKEGRYPIKDKDISAEDFEELQMVIYPTDKPVTTHNYKRLLKLASRFEMPELTRRIECFLIDFDRNGLDRASVFRLATDTFHLKLVQATLLHRWRDSALLQEELMKTGEYERLKIETKAMMNERFAQACISKDAPTGTPHSSRGNSEDDEDDDYEDDEVVYSDEASVDDYGLFD
ncbi:hypothetical protein PMAYCL1PPCAC_27094, partial [Pristionchus mayeri]